MDKPKNGIWTTITSTTTKITRNKILYGEELHKALELPKEAHISITVPYSCDIGDDVPIDEDAPLEITITTEKTEEKVEEEKK